MATILATTTVDFGAEDESEGILKLEVDSRSTFDGGLNQGKTQFQPGDSAFLLLYASSNVGSISIGSNHGSLQAESAVTIDVDDLVTINGAEETTLPFPVSSNWSASWEGQEFNADSNQPATIGITLVDGRKVVFSQPAAGFLKLSYQANPAVYRLNNIPQGVDRVFVRAAGQT